MPSNTAENTAARRHPQGTRGGRWLYRLAMLLTALLGLAMSVLGGWLLAVGGHPYYLLAGVMLVASAVLAVRGRHTLALGVFAAMLAGSLLWSLLEIGGKGWLPAWGIDLGGRMGLPTALFAAALLGWVLWQFAPRSSARRITVAGLLTSVAAVVVAFGVHWERVQSPGQHADAAPLAAVMDGTDPAAEWTHFGGNAQGRRYTTLAQITPQNVDGLKQAWRFDSGDFSPAPGRVFYSAQNTPIKVGELLYTCTPSNQVYALDPGTGEVRWHYDPLVPARVMESMFSAACRAVGYFDAGAASDTQALTTPASDTAYAVARSGSTCQRRIYVATADSRLIALDAVGGYVCKDFGDGGTVDLSIGMGMRETGFASNTSGVTVAGGVLLVGQQVSDNQRRDAPSGVVRAYDAMTGELRWAWDALRADAQAPLAPGEIYPRGTPNVWNVISADESLGLAFLATGNPGADHWGGNRTPEEDATTAAVIAVDLATGATRWHYATVQHDLWDYDLGAQPMLLDAVVDGAPRRAVMQGTKAGNLFLLDAATGEPLTEVQQRPAPQGVLPGDYLSPTQPQSTFYPNLGGVPGPEPERIDARHAFGLTPIDAALCRIQFHRMRYEGLYTPPTDQGLGTLLVPGTIGGMNWGGLGFDPVNRLIISNHSRLPNRVQMYPRDEVNELPVGSGGARPDQAIAPHAGTPWGVDRPMWLSPLGVPCIAPPWGYLAATNIDTGELVWSQPLGTGRDSGPLGLPTGLQIPMGTANLGGPLLTASGLTFIAAAQDDYLRAFDTRSGALLWRARLPAGGQAGAMSYEHNGRQYIAISATGHARLETRLGDALIVYALEE